jgi:hypothetical protein
LAVAKSPTGGMVTVRDPLDDVDISLQSTNCQLDAARTGVESPSNTPGAGYDQGFTVGTHRALQRAGRVVDPIWWWSGTLDGRLMREVLRQRDIGGLFRFLGARGWSRAAIAAAASLSENRVRAICQGRQKVTSYEVLERISEGLGIERGLLGLAYVDDVAPTQPRCTPRAR